MNVVLFQSSCLLPLTDAQCSPQDTKSAFGNYLLCIKSALDADYGSYEREVHDHTRKSAAACFATTIADANTKERCVLAAVDLESKAWDRNGPLRDCSICRTVR
jgi:hypothetical protein